MSNSNSLINNVSGKIAIIDQRTYEQFYQKSDKPCKIKNAKYRKSQQEYNISHFIRSKTQSKKQAKRTAYVIYRKKTKVLRKCKRRKSRLKKSILRHRLLKINSEQSKLNVSASSEADEITKHFENLTIQNIFGGHSRKFREYCDNTTSKELCTLVETLLRELHRFQKRTFESNEYKGRYRRRIVVGFREIQAQMQINKIKFVVIATDCEKCDLKCGLDETIINIRENCKKNLIPCAFALQRRQLGYILFKNSPISCVGVMDFSGAQEVFFKTLSVLELEKNNYNRLCEANSSK